MLFQEEVKNVFQEVIITRERDVEQALIRQVKKSGGLCLKFVSPGWSGVPDRLCLFLGGKIAFVELKAPGRKPRPLQTRRVEQLENLGFPVYIIDRKEQIPELIAKVGGGEVARP